jgi:hypothetical protein
MTSTVAFGRMTALLLAFAFAQLADVHGDPLACQPNAEQPMLPIYHIIGNVTKNVDGSIKLEAINDCSGVTYSQGIYHVWHQCCQNHCSPRPGAHTRPRCFP